MVSICIATYNGEKFISEQLKSILKQINNDDEVIISDDGSTDKTVNIIKSINDRRIKLFYNNGKHGSIYNFANSLRHSKGEIIFLSDQDDVWLNNKYKIMKQCLKKCDLVHCNSVITDENLKTTNNSFYSVLNNGSGLIKNIIKSTYYGSHMAFKRKIYEDAVPFPDTKEIGHDLWLGLIAEMTGKVRFIDNKLMLYRRHTDAFCGEIGAKSKRNVFKKMFGRVIMLYYIAKFKLKVVLVNEK